jgi:hypothetical protein
LREALKRLSDYFSSIGGRYRIYHKSFEDWLLDPGRAKHFAVDRAAGHKLLGTYCWRSFYAHRSQSEVIIDIDSEDWRYTIRFGVEHLVQSGNLDQAVELLSFIYERWDEERVAGTTFATLRPPLLVRAVFRALADCAPEAKQKIEPFDLIPLLKSFYQIEPLAAPIEILVRFHRTKWPDILDELLQEEENYVLRYAISQILGSICTERDAPISLSDISSYLNRPELVYRELGAYALRHLYGRKPELIKLEHLERMGDDETYSGRAALGDLLLNVELQKRYDSTRVQSTLFWKPIWPYNSIDVWDLGAVRLLRAGKSPSNDTDEHVKEAYENLEQTEALRKRLLEEERIKADETVCGLVKDFYQLGLNPRRLRNARNRVKGSPHMLDLLRLAFSHPLWNVAEEAASELASFVEREPQMISAVETLLQESYWRVRFGATETAYQLASGDDIGLFGKAVARFHNDPNPRLRALCAENLIAYILDRHGDRRAKLLGDFSDAICCWIGEGDAWLLEHVFRLLTALAKDGEDVEALIPNPVPYLLDGLEDWSTLSRTAFLIHIEKRQRARGTQAVTAAA